MGVIKTFEIINKKQVDIPYLFIHLKTNLPLNCAVMENHKIRKG